MAEVREKVKLSYSYMCEIHMCVCDEVYYDNWVAFPIAFVYFQFDMNVYLLF